MNDNNQSFPIYRCEEWQCRYVFLDKRCCTRPDGHDGDHEHAPTSLNASAPGRVPPGAALDQLIAKWKQYADELENDCAGREHPICAAKIGIWRRCADELETLRAALDAQPPQAPQAPQKDVTGRTVAIIAALHDLKEDVLHDAAGFQPAFDAGLLEGALSILRANLDTDDPRVKAEEARQINARALRVLAASADVRPSEAAGLP